MKKILKRLQVVYIRGWQHRRNVKRDCEEDLAAKEGLTYVAGAFWICNMCDVSKRGQILTRFGFFDDQNYHNLSNMV